MNYYEVAILKSPLSPLTYQSEDEIKIGTKVEVKLARRKAFDNGVVVKQVSKPSFKCTDISNITNYFYDEIMLKTAQFISSYYICSFGEALSVYIPFNEQCDKTTSKYISQNDIVLSQMQEEMYNFTQKNKSSLLFAATGSGKTEIYIQAIDNVLKLGKQAVMLMPEISLTPQMENRLTKIFGNQVAIWHSKITLKKKNEILLGLKSDKIKLITGARSALFLPYSNLGLIVVDEEHDDSYKSDQKPRLNVKDLSLYMANKFDIKVILGSATPSITSFVKVPYIRNKTTYFKTDKTIDYDNQFVGLTQLIIDKISNTISKNEQAIIFLPTRANFKYQICSDCGQSIQCPFCSVSMSLHKNQKALKCHYCNYTQPIKEKCDFCNGTIKNYRLGTAEIQQQLQRQFDDKIIERFDRDSIKTDKELKNVLKKFNDNKIDILVGTQMLSKGHDYHNVTLAVILGIDSVLNMTSFRSRERALALALQIAGRSGRKGFGEVLIQTKNKELFEKYLELNNYEEFLKEELNLRGNLYPPNVRLAKVIFAHTNHQIAYEQLMKYVKLFKYYKEIELIGFKECEIFKIANKYRYEMLLRSKDAKALISLLHTINSPIASIDMDCLL